MNVGRYGVLLKALSSPRVRSMKLPAAGLFLYMDEDLGFGRVKLGSGSRFDVLPVQSTSMVPGGKFAMSITDAWAVPEAGADGAMHKENWTTFNPALGEITLTARLRSTCLFEESNVKAQRMHLIVPFVASEDAAPFASFRALRMEGTCIVEEDGDDAVSSEVSFVSYPVEVDKTPVSCSHLSFASLYPDEGFVISLFNFGSLDPRVVGVRWSAGCAVPHSSTRLITLSLKI